MSIRRRWGIVRVVSGAHRGKVGWYDDDEFDEKERHRAIVYFGEPLKADYFLLKYRQLRKATRAQRARFEKNVLAKMPRAVRLFAGI